MDSNTAYINFTTAILMLGVVLIPLIIKIIAALKKSVPSTVSIEQKQTIPFALVQVVAIIVLLVPGISEFSIILFFAAAVYRVFLFNKSKEKLTRQSVTFYLADLILCVFAILLQLILQIMMLIKGVIHA